MPLHIFFELFRIGFVLDGKGTLSVIPNVTRDIAH
jgi:hypothetical protein